jgi:hypothetical protein
MTDTGQTIEAHDAAFEAAFKEVSAAIDSGVLPSPDGAPPVPQPDPAPQVVGEAPVETPPLVEQPVEGPEPDPVEGEGGEEAPTEPEALQEPPKDTPNASDEALKRLADAIEAQNARQQAPQQPQQPQDAAQQPQMPELFTPDEAKLLVTFKEEYPEIAQALQVAQRAQGKLFQHMMEQQLAAATAPLLDTIDVLVARTQHMDLTQAIPDYDEYRDKVIEWATSEKQPTYLRKAYSDVIQYGSPNDIKDLYQRFYQETGVRPVAAQQPAPVTAPKVAVRSASELPASAKQAARALAPVGSKRSEIPTANDPNDFDGAFNKWKDADIP